MKKLHLFILKSYLGPLVATFFISLFVLLLQILWRYIDILVGKGLDTLTLSELLFYAVLQVMPMALPLAVLLASLMTFGNMGENYELTAIKASGVSLFKTMRPLIILTALISISAFAFADNVMPWANLKFQSLMYSIQTHQPELEIKEKVFNNMDAYTIKVDHKDKETNMLYGVMIYDHSNRKNPSSNVTMAEKGSINMDENTQMMQLTLYNGSKFEENTKQQAHSLTSKDKQKFRHDTFKKQRVLLNAQNTQFNRIDESGYMDHNKMKNIQQLRNDIRNYKNEQISIIRQIKDNNKQNINAHFPPTIAIDQFKEYLKTSSLRSQQTSLRAAKRMVQNKLIDLNNDITKIRTQRSKQLQHQVELHRKFTLPFICFIFFFIGSSLGAIIRKGGLGMPVVLAIAFFIVFYILDTLGANMALKEALPLPLGMWLSSTVLLIIGVFLTYQSANDSSLLNIEDLKTFIKKRFRPESFNLQNSLDEEQ
ncbi:LptF/LptG family permease [Carboxylicivirga sp. M1479]|uniref:LptF/LptG family permease n=1 Tax=Carboxylicivirga sp. M1479 TaxID=2594476 RepID=UPI0011786EB2|nr:LptF/LptG family permease [Carboxylicivirga sp. M1479]TRX63542.1 YjgP/YjgQ family permease [Carboxylicivirga sp. M1479]